MRIQKPGRINPCPNEDCKRLSFVVGPQLWSQHITVIVVLRFFQTRKIHIPHHFTALWLVIPSQTQTPLALLALTDLSTRVSQLKQNLVVKYTPCITNGAIHEIQTIFSILPKKNPNDDPG